MIAFLKEVGMRKFFFVLSIPVTLLLIAGFHMSTPAARAYVNAQGQQIIAPDSICHPEYRLSDGRTMLFQKNARDMEVWGRLLEREGVLLGRPSGPPAALSWTANSAGESMR